MNQCQCGALLEQGQTCECSSGQLCRECCQCQESCQNCQCNEELQDFEGAEFDEG